MLPVVTTTFKSWLKSSSNIKLSSNAAVTRLTYEGITNFSSLVDFDKKSIEALPAICEHSIPVIAEDRTNGVDDEPEIPGANINSIFVHCLIVACNASKCYTSIDRYMTVFNMRYGKVLAGFKVEWEAFFELKGEDSPKCPTIMDKNCDRKVLKWMSPFRDYVSRTYGSKGPLSYVLRPISAVVEELDNPLAIYSYYGESVCLHEELCAHLPHTGPIYKHNNTAVFLLIEKASIDTSCESKVKAFARTKYGQGAYNACISNHAVDTKYHAIHKKCMNLLQHIKRNSRTYALEAHITNHRQAVDDIR